MKSYVLIEDVANPTLMETKIQANKANYPPGTCIILIGVDAYFIVDPLYQLRQLQEG